MNNQVIVIVQQGPLTPQQEKENFIRGYNAQGTGILTGEGAWDLHKRMEARKSKNS